MARIALSGIRRPLTRWDQGAASSADRYLVISSWIARQVKRLYGFEAEVVPPPVTVEASGSQHAVDGVEPGYFLCVSRLLPYKNIAAIVEAFEKLGSERLIVVGEGPDEERLKAHAGRNILFVGAVGDAELRWLYANSMSLVTASYEDFGLTPLEAAAFGKPTAALRFGGFLDTIREGETGVFFERPDPAEIAAAVKRLANESWNGVTLQAHAASFSETRFRTRIREIVAEEITIS